MQITQNIEKLKNISLPYTEVISATYEDTGSFTTDDGTILSDIPPFYRVVLHSAFGEGSFVRNEVWLPVNWNGIFYGLGNGGIAGGIYHNTLADNVKEGYAIANTDMGTSRGRDSGIGNPDVWKDFGWRATHEMTTQGKALVRCLYGKDPDYSYFWGGSTGGQQGIMLAQRFPEDYDGIVSGVPANNRTQLHTYFLWNHIHLRDKDGNTMFTHEEVEKLTDCAVRFYQSRGDGEKGDNFVTFPSPVAAEIDSFLEFLADDEAVSFNDEQMAALKAIYYGPTNPRTGERIYNGMPIGSEKYGCGIEECQMEESPHFYPFIWAFGADYDGRTFDFDKDMDKLNSVLAAELNANDPDLSAFAARGGKLFMYSGASDPCVPFPDAVQYYNRITEVMGGIDKTKDFCRYFLLPGKEHGRLGDGTNVIWENENGGEEIDIIRHWREENKAPDTVTAVGYFDADPEKGVRFTRPVTYYGSPQDTISAVPKSQLLVCDTRYLG